MKKLFEKVREEFLAMLPPTVFFFISLSILAVVHSLMLKGTDIPIVTQLQVAIGALILGKAVLISDMLPLINRYPDKPLAYNVAWKTAIYFLISLVIHYIERLLDFWKEAGGLVAANDKLLATIIWPHFWAIQIILIVLIFDYCLIHEFARVLGAGRLREMFFGAATRAAS